MKIERMFLDVGCIVYHVVLDYIAQCQIMMLHDVTLPSSKQHLQASCKTLQKGIYGLSCTMGDLNFKTKHSS